MNNELEWHLYDEEWTRRDQLQQAVSTPLGILTLLAGGVVFLVTGYQPVSARVNVLFWSGLVISVIVLGIASYMVIRSYYGYTYRRIPFPVDLIGYRNDLKGHFERIGTSERAEAAFSSYLAEQLVDASDRNSRNNADRGAYLHKANGALAAAFCLIAITAVPYLIGKRTEDPVVHQVQLVSERGNERKQASSDAAGTVTGESAGTADSATKRGH